MKKSPGPQNMQLASAGQGMGPGGGLMVSIECGNCSHSSWAATGMLEELTSIKTSQVCQA